MPRPVRPRLDAARGAYPVWEAGRWSAGGLCSCNNWRASIIPLLLAVAGVDHRHLRDGFIFGFRSTPGLFVLVLAIGHRVDDAIVVSENGRAQYRTGPSHAKRPMPHARSVRSDHRHRAVLIAVCVPLCLHQRLTVPVLPPVCR